MREPRIYPAPHFQTPHPCGRKSTHRRHTMAETAGTIISWGPRSILHVLYLTSSYSHPPLPTLQALCTYPRPGHPHLSHQFRQF